MSLKLENQQISSAASSVELIARAQRGEEKAFEALFHQHKKHVYCLCLRVLGNPAEAEELTQDAFLQLFRKIHTFRGQSAFSTWLHRLTLNLALMRLRKKTISVTSLEGGAGEDEFDEPRTELGAPDAVLTGSLERVHLERAIAQLPPGYRQAFLLHDVQGYQHNEIAAMLGMSIGNSKSQLHKARIALRKLLLETGNDRRGRKELQLQPV
jgi:RNA polymerase sigma-70 factor (ECF subfamily)